MITHPISGRKSLYVNPGFTLGFEGWTDEESAPLLQFLYRHGARAEFTCRLNWREGSLAFWDNRAAMHHAMWDYFPHKRLGYRVTVKGDKPFYRA